MLITILKNGVDTIWREPRFPAEELPGPIFPVFKNFISALHGRTGMLRPSLESYCQELSNEW